MQAATCSRFHVLSCSRPQQLAPAHCYMQLCMKRYWDCSNKDLCQCVSQCATKLMRRTQMGPATVPHCPECNLQPPAQCNSTNMFQRSKHANTRYCTKQQDLCLQLIMQPTNSSFYLTSVHGYACIKQQLVKLAQQPDTEVTPLTKTDVVEKHILTSEPVSQSSTSDQLFNEHHSPV